MRTRRMLPTAMLAMAFMPSPQSTWADTPASGPAAPVVNQGDGTLVYEAVEVQGNVRVAPTGTDPKVRAGWDSLKTGDTIKAGQQISVGIRSKVKLVARPADPPTVLLFDRLSLVNISELQIKDGAARSRIQLAHGAVRAGVAEGSTRSDMEIEAPVAVLSKKGTDIFQIEYDGNGQYRMSLSEQGRGLIQAIQTQSTSFGGLQNFRSRFVTPGQFITQALTRAIDNVQFDRTVNVNDVFGLGGADQLFAMLNDRGLGIMLNPGGNWTNLLGNNNPATGTVTPTDPTQQNDQSVLQQLNNTSGPRPTPGFIGGDFGIGQGRLPGIGRARNSFFRAAMNGSKGLGRTNFKR
ncbi:hypothetical protein RAS2_10620 [Phycisphaerae bacterium RAS2]|nr:hypothetical protein RAS2_10620 [Phycisphaerae bacterium RAS2]